MPQYAIQTLVGQTYAGGGHNVILDPTAEFDPTPDIYVLVESNPHFVFVAAGTHLTGMTGTFNWDLLLPADNVELFLEVVSTSFANLQQASQLNVGGGVGAGGDGVGVTLGDYTMPVDGYVGMSLINYSGSTLTAGIGFLTLDWGTAVTHRWTVGRVRWPVPELTGPTSGTYIVDFIALGVVDETDPPDEFYAGVFMQPDPPTAEGYGDSGITEGVLSVFLPAGVNVVSVTSTVEGTPFATGTLYAQVGVVGQGWGTLDESIEVDAQVNVAVDTATATVGPVASVPEGLEVWTKFYNDTGLTGGSRPSITGGQLVIEWEKP